MRADPRDLALVNRDDILALLEEQPYSTGQLCGLLGHPTPRMLSVLRTMARASLIQQTDQADGVRWTLRSAAVLEQEAPPRKATKPVRITKRAEIAKKGGTGESWWARPELLRDRTAFASEVARQHQARLDRIGAQAARSASMSMVHPRKDQ